MKPAALNVALLRSSFELVIDRQPRLTLVAVMDRLEDAPWLSSTLKQLGAKHVGYGVTPEMYAWVGGSLLATLAEAGGPYWSPALQSAWTDAYAAIAGLMQAGAREASSEAV